MSTFAISAGASTEELVNPTLTDSLITSNTYEQNTLINNNWEDALSLKTTSSKSTPVYRLYNPNTGQHYFTKDASEKNGLVSRGWNYERIAFYSGGSKAIYVYYNPSNGAHFYGLPISGTVRQGVAFYTN